MIRVVNLKDYKKASPKETLIKVDRSSILGNPYPMKNEADRDNVCDMYNQYFDALLMSDKPKAREFKLALDEIMYAAGAGLDVALGCWCAPKRCHADTIKCHIESRMNRKVEPMDYNIGDLLEVIEPCGFEVGKQLEVTGLYNFRDDVIIDGVAVMSKETVNRCFKLIKKAEIDTSSQNCTYFEQDFCDGEHCPGIDNCMKDFSDLSNAFGESAEFCSGCGKSYACNQIEEFCNNCKQIIGGKTMFRELKGDMMKLMTTGSYDAICILTNGFVKKDGACVMGRGIALSFKNLIPEIPYILGNGIKAHGNRVLLLGTYSTAKEPIKIFSFPTKHRWDEDADLEVIKKSCHQMVEQADKRELKNILIGRMGAGNGRLNWETQVKPVVSGILDSRFIVCTF
jgi:hypothetical protein